MHCDKIRERKKINEVRETLIINILFTSVLQKHH